VALLGTAPVVLVVVLSVAMSGGIGGEQLGSVDPRIGIAADFTLTTFEGEEFTLPEPRGRAGLPLFLGVVVCIVPAGSPAHRAVIAYFKSLGCEEQRSCRTTVSERY
jgi:hypothetical protein